MRVESGVWICHRGCGQGNFTSLVELVLGCSYQEANDWVYGHGSRNLPAEELSRRLNILLSAPHEEQILKDSPVYWLHHYLGLSNKAMPLWFLKRGFTWETIWHHDIRYDPALDAVVLPVKWAAELIGTVTRHTDPRFPKYQNSQDLPKSDILFGEISASSNEIILCEGVLDALWLWQLGYNAGSLLGSELHAGQIKVLRQYKYAHIVLALDNDVAGRKGTTEAIARLTSAGWAVPQITIMRFPPGYKDAQDCPPEMVQELYQGRRDSILSPY